MSETVNDDPADGGMIEETRAATRAAMAADNLTMAAVATAAGIAYGTFSSFMVGSYKGRNDEIARKTRTWLSSRDVKARTRAAMPAAPAYVATPTASGIVHVLSHAQHGPDLAVVAGGAGIGKTTAALEYARTSSNVWVMTVQPVTASPHAFISEVSEMLGVADGAWDRRARALVKRLMGTGGLLIVDEAQNLTSRALDQVRALHDLGGIGVALVGNETVLGRLEGEGRRQQFAQLFSRIGMRLTRARPLTADVDAILDAWEVHGALERRLLSTIARKPGALRGLTKILRLARMQAAASDAPLRVEDIHQAWRMLGDTAPLLADAA